MYVVTMNVEQANVAIGVVSVILAAGSILSPLIFGFVLWKMSQIFVSKEEFGSFKMAVDKKDEDTKKTMENINNNMIELLQRTAHLRQD